uniref:Small ribosomal subunit protein uS15m n=1 Tax=Ailuropoda melanoleuca TaxID=9646 RepID=A0A7N5KH11_AILME
MFSAQQIRFVLTFNPRQMAPHFHRDTFCYKRNFRSFLLFKLKWKQHRFPFPPTHTCLSLLCFSPRFDDVVRRLLSLEMANQKEKLKIKQELLMNKILANPEDTNSLEARIVALTVKIRSYEEHMQKHRKDKAHKRYLLMSIDQRKKMLKNLRKTNYSVFEKTCKELGIEYTSPPLYNRKGHQRWAAKKALCIRVFQEVQKLKKQKRALKAKAAAQKQGQKNPESPSKAGPEAIEENQ